MNKEFSTTLLENQNLFITTIIGLDRVQKKQSITDTAATKTETKHTRSRGLAKPQLKEFVLQHLRQFSATSRSKLEELLFDMLPTSLTAEKKKNKVKNAENGS